MQPLQLVPIIRDEIRRGADLLRAVHGTGSLSSGARLLQFRSLRDRATWRLFHERERGAVFGTLMAAQFAEIGKNWPTHRLCDRRAGAHHGEFATHVLEALRETHLKFFSLASVIGSSSRFRFCANASKAVLRRFRDKTEWAASVEKMDSFCGVHFSNELLDVFPVHLLSRWQKKSGAGRSAGSSGPPRGSPSSIGVARCAVAGAPWKIPPPRRNNMKRKSILPRSIGSRRSPPNCIAAYVAGGLRLGAAGRSAAKPHGHLASYASIAPCRRPWKRSARAT